VTAWAVTAGVLAVLLLVGAAAVLRGRPLERAVGLQLAGILATLLAVVVAVGSGRRIVLDVALVLAVVTLTGGLAYARFLERWV
jgi:multicomponent Na+:H+ antiporter subunit F